MKRLLPVLMGVALLLLSSTEGWSLPTCPGSPTSSGSTAGSWTDCFGTIIYSDGSKYGGEWKDRKWHGQGILYYADGSVEQEGIFENNKFLYAKKLSPTVTARMAPTKWSSLPPCVGNYTVYNWTDCIGIVTYSWGTYVGEYKDGWRHGQGTYTNAEGHKYVGEFKDGKYHGKGTYTYPDGRVKKGIFENNKFLYVKKPSPTVTAKKSPTKGSGLPPCQGSPTSSNNLMYYWTDCFGTLTFTDGKYVGEWKGLRKHGQGTFTFASGSKYVGEYKDDKRNGQGTYTFANGDKHVGEFRNNKRHGQGTYTFTDGIVWEGIWENNKFLSAKKPSPTVTAKKSPTPSSSKNEKELEKLRKEIARLKKEKKQKPKPSSKPSGTSGSGFFISKLGHVITNQHVVSDCRKVTVGDNSKKQVTATVMETDRRNDLALLRISNMKMASAETKTLIRKLGIKVVPLATDGLMRAEDVELGEDVLVAGYPYGAVFSDNIKVNKGIVSGLRGMGDDTGQFQIDAAVQPGNSGGPIYDENGNIVGVVVSQLNKRKFEKIVGSIPENVNFGIKASTVRQFLNASGLPTKWSKRSKSMSTRELAKIAKSQTVMVVCHR